MPSYTTRKTAAGRAGWQDARKVASASLTGSVPRIPP